MKMYAIEFETDVQDGVVQIPEEYQQLRNKHVRVVVLVKDDDADMELEALSNHSANLVDDWHHPSEDEVWR